MHGGAEQAEHLVMPLGGEYSVSGQGDPVQDLACRYRSLWLSLARTRDMIPNSTRHVESLDRER